MSNQALTWAYGLYLGSAPQKAVLLYLADRAREDGTCAWPSVMHISIVTELSVSSVKTALRKLRERGLIVPGDQRHAALGRNNTIIPRNRRSKVWDLRLNIPIESFEDVESAEEVERRLREEKREKERAGKDEFAGPATDPEPENHAESLGCRRCTPENKAEKTLGCRRCTSRGAGGVPKPKSITHYPSAPTGHLPASGATAAEKNKTEQLDEDDTEIAEAAGRVLASLGAQRSMLGLATPSPTKADRKAIIGLYRRLVDQGAQWPTLVMVDAIGFAMNGDWWPKRIRTGRALARHWDELNDDMILAAGRTDGDAHAQTVPAAVPEPDAAPWLPDWAVKTLAELDGQDATAGGEATA